VLPIDIDFGRDLGAARMFHLPWWVLLAPGVSSAVCAASFDHIKRIELALPVMNSGVVFGYLIALRWNLRKRIWFWGTIIVCAALPVPLIMAIPWTTKWVAPFAIATIGTVDFCVVLAVLAFIQSSVDENEAAEG